MTNDELKARVSNLRADLVAQRLLMDSMIIAMTPAARAALKHNFRHLSEQWISGALAHAQSDETVHSVQRSVDHLATLLDSLPHS